MEYTVRGREQLQAVASRIVTQLSPDKVWRITIGPHKVKRSLPQNDRFHKLIALLAEETGEDPRRLKEWTKAEFGPVETIQVGDSHKTIPKASSKYTTEEMTVVMDRLEAFCAREMGVMLGEPQINEAARSLAGTALYGFLPPSL